MHYQEQMEESPTMATDEAFQNSPRSSSSSSSRRGLSKHYKGKSQSFTSLSEALTLEDLSKPENPFNAKLKQRRESPHCRRVSGCGRASEQNLGGRDVNDRQPRLSGNRPPLRAQTLSAAHFSAFLTRT